MPYFAMLGADAGVRDILKLNRAAGRALVQFHEAVLRQPSPLTVAERELIAALVSGLNSCGYCYGVHTRTAAELGVDAALIAALLSDIDTANVAPKMRPLLRFARKLTLTPASITPADAGQVFAAGWSEQALHDAIQVICLFNFMNRLVDAHGVQGSGALFEQRGQQLAAGGYLPLLDALADQ